MKKYKTVRNKAVWTCRVNKIWKIYIIRGYINNKLESIEFKKRVVYDRR